MNCFRRIIFMSILAASCTAHATPCPDLYYDMKDPKTEAEWIIEGTEIEIKKTGSFTDCEYGPRCGSVDNPEIIVLDNISVIRSDGNFTNGGKTEISRKSHCFSGALSFMDAKPELNAIGKRMRFYGNEFTVRPFIKAGYFWVEPVD